MKIEVKLFAAVRQLAGRESILLDLPAGATIAQVRQVLAQVAPDLADLVDQSMFAVNAEYAADHVKIPPDAEVACIPPVSGG